MHILSISSLGVIWQWPSGSFFSICVGLTHFSPRPHPTVLFPKHMCGGGRGISECLPPGTRCHSLPIWLWTLLLLPFYFLQRMSSIPGWFLLLLLDFIQQCTKWKSQKCDCQSNVSTSKCLCVLCCTVCICTVILHCHDISYLTILPYSAFKCISLVSSGKSLIGHLTWSADQQHSLCRSQ